MSFMHARTRVVSKEKPSPGTFGHVSLRGAGMGKRCQYYFIWGLSEASINAAGFGFNGYKDAEKTQPKFDRYRNTQVYQVCVPVHPS